MSEMKRPRGRPKGSQNKNTVALKKLIVLAGEAAGEKMGLQKQEISEEGGLVAYLTHLALEHPGCFATLLGKVMAIQQQDEVRGRTHKNEDGVVNIKIGFFPDTPQQGALKTKLGPEVSSENVEGAGGFTA